MKCIKIHSRDNVVVTLTDLTFMGEVIPKGHKVAAKEIAHGEPIIKYGMPIGVATVAIPEGSWVHTHNVKTTLDETVDYEYQPISTASPQNKAAFFQGYLRKDGRCAVRNEIWIIATVGCVNSIADEIARKMQTYGKGKVDGIYAITHPYGCSQMGTDQENTLTALAALADHPNGGGVLFLGLGCENCNFDVLRTYLPECSINDKNRIKWLQCQQVEDEIDEGMGLVQQLVDYAGQAQRQSIETSKLVVGLKCGGSDGLSGITANPLVGMFSDRLCGEGGSVILTEVPEMFGAEKLLMRRCRDRIVFEQTVQLIQNYKDYFRQHGQVIYENPSPGNKAGGITTLEDKSLGCVQKGGNSSVNGVLRYGEVLKETGLNLLAAPGNDLVASTALALSGAHLILFTTGRGTPFGGPIPTVKIASNHGLCEKKANWVDYDGEIMLDRKDKAAIEDHFYQFVMDVASGRQTKSEMQGYRDIAILKQGVTL